ncbi:MAG: 1,3-beta-galactosyl-N-acetylhexosamine phosphorylase [Peptoniphilaceae bacterium]|nr:1,3-beta-galactosyl-N-acetylhexosamine phosphorylase [Peptoniphilaceae bacterium]MDY6018759.1 1,3-beta-galactosyl-N-acetylhexosamine phosphorylase [Anaerococcus sp.]
MMEKRYSNTKGRLTLPSQEDFYEQTIEMIERTGADALRDSDGTKLPENLKDLNDVDIYTTYFTARSMNDFAQVNMVECSRYYLMSNFVTATSESTPIDFLEDYYKEQIKADYDYDPKKWWEVYDRTTGEVVDPKDWQVDKEKDQVVIKSIPFHVYTVTFLAYGIWDPVQMYNYITNGWEDVEKDIPVDIRYPKSLKQVEDSLSKWLKENPKTDVVRFTTFFYQFSLVFNKEGLEKHVDWFGYTNTISPEAMIAFEKEYGYKLRPEDIVDQGYYNSTFKVPSKVFMDYIDFQSRFVSQEAKKLVDIVHKAGKKAIMFLGDHWIGTEPYGKYFKDIGLDGVVGSVGDGVTLRLISDIDVGFTEGRLLPYFFPDTFHEGNDPTIEAKDNWVKARRALLRNPLDRIGYGGYLSLAYAFPDFVNYMTKLADEYRQIYDTMSKSKKPYTAAKVAILNCWGKLRTWAPFIVAHGKWYKLSYSYMGMMEALAGMDVDVEFINFDDIKNGIDPDIDVIINAGDAYTAFSGADNFLDPKVVENIRKFVYEGGGFIGIGEPSAYQANGRYFQLADILGLDIEKGYSQSNDKYFTTQVGKHFIIEDLIEALDFGESKSNVYAISKDTQIIEYSDNEVHMAANDFGKGRSFYMTGMPYSFQNTRILKRAIAYVSHKEDDLKKYYADDIRLEVAAYPDLGKYCLVNNSAEEVTSMIYDGEGNAKEITIEGSELIWLEE